MPPSINRKLIASAIALACVGASVSASEFYVVVPLKNRTVNPGITLRLAGDTLPAGVVGTAYQSVDFNSLLVIKGDPNYTGYGVKWRVTAGSLPAGLTLNPSTGVLSGTPTSKGTASFEIQAAYKTLSGNTAYQVIVNSITINLDAGAPPDAVVGVHYSYNLKPLLSVQNDNSFTGDVTWSVVSSTLPAGLTLRTDGTISGTPTSGGTGSITARATYRGNDGEQTYRIVTQNITVALATAQPPEAMVGQSYSFDLNPLLAVKVDGAPTADAATWSVISTSLPPGLYLRNDGQIVGTPTAAGTGSVTARASYKGINGEQTYQIVTLNVAVALSPATPTQALMGQAYLYDLKPYLVVSGDSAYDASNVTWSVVASTLPTGLYLRTDGKIGGTPTAAGTGTITARASYKGQSGEQTYQVVTLNVVVGLAAGTPPQAVVGQAYNYDLKTLLNVTGDTAYAGTGVTWSVVSSTLPAGLYLRNDGVIGGTPTASGSGSISVRATYKGVNGEQAYEVVTINVSVNLQAATPPQAQMGQPYSYDLSKLLNVTGDSAYTGTGVSWSVVANTLPAGLYLRNDGTITGTPTAVGSGTITARASYKGVKGEQTYQIVTINVAVSLATATPPQAIVGQPYSYDLKQQLSVSGDSGYDGSGVTWSVVSSNLPAGLTLRADGTIGGLPTAGGTGTVTARATYRGNNGEQTYQVVSLNIAVSLAAATPPQAQVGQPYTFDLKTKLAVSGDTGYAGTGVSWSTVSNSLPAGLTLGSDGVISGTPTAGGTGAITARATYRGNNGEQTYQIVSLNIAVTLATATPPQAQVGQTYSYDLKQQLTISGDSAYAGSGVTWSVVSSSLPAGLTLRADGTIGGTPTAGGTGSITARASYRGVNGEQTYQVVSLNISVALATATPPQAIVGQAYSYNVKALLNVAGDPGYSGANVTWDIVSGALPSGLTLQSNGTISGTAVAAANQSVTVRATYKNVAGQQTYQVISINIAVALAAVTPSQALVGQPYTFNIKPLLSVTGDAAYTSTAVSWSVAAGALPAGLSLDSNGVISGTPTAAATVSPVIRASYRGVNGEQTYQLVVLKITVALAAVTPTNATVDSYYAYDLKTNLAVTGDASYNSNNVTWAVVAGNLPPGFAISPAGVVTGYAPTDATSTTLTVQATYRNISSTPQSYTFSVVDPYTYAWAADSYEFDYIVTECSWDDAYQNYMTRTAFWRYVWCRRSNGTEVDTTKCTGTRPRATKTTYTAC